MRKKWAVIGFVIVLPTDQTCSTILLTNSTAELIRTGPDFPERLVLHKEKMCRQLLKTGCYKGVSPLKIKSPLHCSAVMRRVMMATKFYDCKYSETCLMQPPLGRPRVVLIERWTLDTVKPA